MSSGVSITVLHVFDVLCVLTPPACAAADAEDSEDVKDAEDSAAARPPTRPPTRPGGKTGGARVGGLCPAYRAERFRSAGGSTPLWYWSGAGSSCAVRNSQRTGLVNDSGRFPRHYANRLCRNLKSGVQPLDTPKRHGRNRYSLGVPARVFWRRQSPTSSASSTSPASSVSAARRRPLRRTQRTQRTSKTPRTVGGKTQPAAVPNDAGYAVATTCDSTATMHPAPIHRRNRSLPNDFKILAANRANVRVISTHQPTGFSVKPEPTVQDSICSKDLKTSSF